MNGRIVMCAKAGLFVLSLLMTAVVLAGWSVQAWGQSEKMWRMKNMHRRFGFLLTAIAFFVLGGIAGKAYGVQEGFLAFPIVPISGPSLTPYNARISAVFDHLMTGPNLPNDQGAGVQAYTGEKGTVRDATPATSYNGVPLYGYKNADETTAFSVNGQYDPSGTKSLFYEGHTGYDYPYSQEYEVVAAAGGILHKVNDETNTVWIDHENGYSTWYLHMLPADTNALINGARVSQGQHLGYCGNYYQGSFVGYHLHFTVKKGTIRVDPYGWNEKAGIDPYFTRYGVNNTNLWKLQAPGSPSTLRSISADTGAPIVGAEICWNGAPLGYTGSGGCFTLPSELCGMTGTLSAVLNFLHYSGTISVTCPGSKAASSTMMIPLTSNQGCPVSPMASFSIGNRVRVVNTQIGLRGRYPDPCSATYGVFQDGSLGTIVGSVQCCSGYRRWQIVYDSYPSVNVWSAEGDPNTGDVYLEAVSTGPVTPTISSVNGGSSVTLSNSRQWITVQGSNFQSGYSATFWDPSGTPWLVDSARLLWVNSSSLNMYVGLTDAGIWKVQVTNPDGGVSNKFPFSVIETGRVSTPYFTPAPGTYSGSVSVGMTCATSGAAIRYTTTGSDPTASSPVYSGTPVSITSTTPLKAKGFLPGSTSSAINTGLYVISSGGALSPPTFSPSPGQTYTGSVRVYMYASPSAATIRYTMDGSEPTLYSGFTANANPVIIGSTTTFKAKAFYAGNTSSTSTATYTVVQNAVSTPYFSPPPGNYAQGQTISMYCDTPGAYIRYNVGTSEPTETNGWDYEHPIVVGSTMTFRARAFRSGYPSSAVAVGTWTIAPPPPASLQCDPTSIAVTVSRLNPQTSEVLNEHNTSNQSIQAVVSTSQVPWASWYDVQKQIPAYGSVQTNLYFYGASVTPGIHTTTMLVQQSGYAPQEIPVTLTVEDYPAILECSTHNLTATCVERDNAPPDTFTIRNAGGGGTLQYVIVSDVPWLTVSPSEGSSAGEADSIGVMYPTASLAAGEYDGSIAVSACGLPAQTISVHLTVTPYGLNVPWIDNITPNKGPVGGGTKVLIRGRNLSTSTALTFGGIPAVNLTVVDSTMLQAETPSWPTFGKVDAQVVSPDGEFTRADGFEYLLVRGNNIEEVAQIGGATSAIAVQGNYAYIQEGCSLVIRDVSNPATPTQVGRITLPGLVTSIAVSGNFVYAMAQDAGLVILDASNPALPVIRGFHEVPGGNDGSTVAVLGGYAYVVAFVWAGPSALRVFDVIDPDSPQLTGTIDLLSYGFDIAVCLQSSSILAYVAVQGAGVQIIDVTDPTHPVGRGSCTPGTSEICNGIVVQGNYAYTALGMGDHVFGIVDIADPDYPSFVGFCAGGWADDISIDSRGLVYTSGAFLHVYDVSNAQQPIERGGYILQRGDAIAISSTTAYIAQGEFGLAIIDANDPASPALVADLASPLGYAKNLTVNNGYAYCVYQNWGFRIVDVHDPWQPRLRGQYYDQSCNLNALVAAGGFAYGVGGSGVSTFNVADPDSPQLQSESTYPDFIGMYAVTSGNWAYVIGAITNPVPYVYGLHIFDLSNPASPTHYSAVDIPGTDHPGQLAVSGNLICTVQGNGIQIIDVGDPANPSLKGYLDPGGKTYGVAILGTSAYLADFDLGLQIADVSNPMAPIVIGDYAGSYYHDVCVESGRAYVKGGGT